MNNTADRVNNTSIQHRSFDLTSIEFRDDAKTTGFTFEGVASVVDKPYLVRDAMGEFTETIAAGAFDKTLGEVQKRAAKAPTEDVALYINHRSMDVPMASTRGGTLRLFADPNLRVSAELDPARSDVVIARSAIQRKELSQMSIGFRVPQKRDQWNDDFTERTIHEVALNEVSIVRTGANPHTAASMRSVDELLDLFGEGDDLDPNDIQRAISHLERLLPQPAVDQERLEASLKMWEHRRDFLAT
jgi:HK97 family phage prohead protease